MGLPDLVKLTSGPSHGVDAFGQVVFGTAKKNQKTSMLFRSACASSKLPSVVGSEAGYRAALRVGLGCPECRKASDSKGQQKRKQIYSFGRSFKAFQKLFAGVLVQKKTYWVTKTQGPAGASVAR